MKISDVHSWIRSILGCVLLAAAALKARDLGTTAPGEAGIPVSKLLALAQIGIETTLGLLLIAGIFRQLVHLIALVTFSVFASVAVYSTIAGLPSCGCFGRLQVPPLYTAIFDLLAVFGLAAFAPPASPRWARRGGVGLAVDKKLGRQVAIKRLLSGEAAAPSGIEQFLQEARAIAALNHRNIVTIHELGEDERGLYIVMEYLGGGDLRDSIKVAGKIEPGSVRWLRIAAGSADAVPETACSPNLSPRPNPAR